MDKDNTTEVLTVLEKKAIQYIRRTFLINGIDFDKVIKFTKINNQYLTLFAGNTVFCRIKAGTNVFWFAVYGYRLDETKKSDIRFNEVKDKNSRHWKDWKILLKNVEDFNNNSDLIVDTYKSLNISDDELEKVITEEYQIDYEEVYTAPKSTPINSTRKKGNSIIDNLSDYTVIDLETTSKYPNSAEIIELSAVRVRSGQITEKFTQLVKPSKPISKVITDLTGITNEMLSNAPLINDVLQSFIDFIGDDIILGHNIVSFDSTILYDICEKLNMKTLDNDMLDTLRYSHYCDIDVPDHKLKTISGYFGIEHNAHRALNDCIANFEVYEKLKEHFTGKIILTTRQSGKKTIPIENLTINPCYSVKDKNIVLTGEFSCGQRKAVKSYLEKLGALMKSAVSGKTDYLIIGASGSPDWKFGDYGDKVAKAQELQLKGKTIEIIQEEEFFECQKQYDAIESETIGMKNQLLLFEDEDIDYSQKEYYYLQEYISKIDKLMTKEYNSPENFVKYKKNIVNSSVCLVEPKNDIYPLKKQQSVLIFNYTYKGFRNESIKYHVFIVKKRMLNLITAPECSMIKNFESDELNTYVCFSDFNESAMKFIEQVIRYYVEHFEPADKFGCCSKYRECSEAKKCLHNNKFYSKACWYRKNLESGNIFY